MECYNMTIIDRLGDYVSEVQKVCDDFVKLFTYAYSADIYKSTCSRPSSLALSREALSSVDIDPPSVADNVDGNPSRTLKQTILNRINVLKTKTTIAFQQVQEQKS